MMDKVGLNILRANEVLIQMASAWPRVRFAKTSTRQQRVESWARTAGLSIYDVAQFYDTLFDNEICRPDGTLDPLAEGWLTRHGLRGMKLPAPPPPQKGP